MRKLLLLFITVLVIGVLAACGSESGEDADADVGTDATAEVEASEETETDEERENQLSDEKLVVGVTSGPHEEIFEVIQELAAEDGLEIEIKVFTDYIIPNTALAEGDLDVNSYQHQPFMEQFNEDHGTNLAAIASTTLSPIGVYSEEVTDINDVPEGGVIGIPNDPTNGARALIMFEEAGLIKLGDDVNKETASVLDIEENERNLEFKELEAAQIPNLLSEVDLGVVNGNFAVENGLDPATDAIFSESKDTPFVNQLVVRDENKDDPVLEKLVELYYSPEVTEFVLDHFDGVILPSWDY